MRALDRRSCFSWAIGLLCALTSSAAVPGDLQEPIAEQALQQWLEQFGEDAYRVERDTQRRIIYATSQLTLSDAGHQEMRDMLDELADHLSQTLFDGLPEYDVLIAIASPRDARRLFQQHNVGGNYLHRLRRLVSRDTGGSLRHEFFHVMHYGHMEKLNQPHALWVQEGMASLYEDYRLSEGGIEFLPNVRNEITRERARINRLVPWQNVFELPAERFMARATVLYPQARSMFEFVAAQGKLKKWYDAYVEHFDEDSTGKRAFEVAFDAELPEIERQWRQWVLQQPEVKIFNGIEKGRPSLGVGTLPQGSNDGLLITQILPGSTASLGNVQVGDVVVAIDDYATRTMSDVRLAISQRAVGEQVVVRVKRGERYEALPMVLRSLNSQ